MMKRTNDTTSPWKGLPFFLIALSLLIFAAAATAQRGMIDSGTVSDVQIAVQTAEDQAEIEQLRDGAMLQLGEGETVHLRVFAPRGAASDHSGRGYLPARWSLVSRGKKVRLSDINPDRGIVTVTGLETAGRPAELRYELAGKVQTAKSELRSGLIFVQVEKRHGAGHEGHQDGHDGDHRDVTRAEDMVQHFYRGILMRDAKLDKAHEWVAEIGAGGYPSVVEVAYEIVSSRESQEAVYDRGHTHKARLTEIYKHLLDLDEDEIDHYQWMDHLEMMERGDVTDVVMDIVRSPEFRRAHGYQDGR